MRARTYRANQPRDAQNYWKPNTQSTSGWYTHRRSFCHAFGWNPRVVFRDTPDFSMFPCSACRTLLPSPAPIVVRVLKEVGFGPEVIYDLASRLPTQSLSGHGALHASIATQSGGACRPCVYRTHRACTWADKGRSVSSHEDTASAPPGTDGHFQREARLQAGREKTCEGEAPNTHMSPPGHAAPQRRAARSMVRTG